MKYQAVIKYLYLNGLRVKQILEHMVNTFGDQYTYEKLGCVFQNFLSRVTRDQEGRLSVPKTSMYSIWPIFQV